MFEKKKDSNETDGSSGVFRPVKGSAKVLIGNGVKIKGEITDADEAKYEQIILTSKKEISSKTFNR